VSALGARLSGMNESDQKADLQRYLQIGRDAVLWKLEGLSEYNVRRPMTPTGTNLLGLVKHLAAGENYWLCEVFERPSEPGSLAASDDVQLDPGDTIDSVLGYYARARTASGQAIRELDLDTTATTWLGDIVSFRWAILHMIEETARHAGHADLIRERIDKTTGYLPNNLPY